MNDPEAAPQMVRGFYQLESNTWRWTAGKFTVALRPPPGAAERGAKLVFHFTLPPVIFDRAGPVTVTGTVNGASLPGQSFAPAGDYTYSQEVAAGSLKSDAVLADFVCDKSLPASATEPRELALVAISFALESR